MPELADGKPQAILCDADGNLFPSEEPAFIASAIVTNEFLSELGIDQRVEAEQLRLGTTGKNFRTTAVDLAAAYGIRVESEALLHAGDEGAGRVSALRGVLTADALNRWVAKEKTAVTAYLADALRPDPTVLEPLSRLSASYRLAAVSSSASSRLAACFEATQLAHLFPPNLRFSAEDSLPRPASKPDPAVYLYACTTMGIDPRQAIAVEDSVPGAQAAVAARIPTVGNVRFVASGERRERIAQLYAVGVLTVVDSWSALEEHLQSRAATPARSG
jgi:beta-phosphoglucomutase-like phosphatase (HAD superfamily)